MEQGTIRVRVRPGLGSAPALTRSTRLPYSRLPPYTTCPKLMHPSPRGYSRFITTSSPAARTSPRTVSRIARLYATPPESATRGIPRSPAARVAVLILALPSEKSVSHSAGIFPTK